MRVWRVWRAASTKRAEFVSDLSRGVARVKADGETWRDYAARISPAEYRTLGPDEQIRVDRELALLLQERADRDLELLGRRYHAWSQLAEDADPGDLIGFDVMAVYGVFAAPDELRLRAARRLVHKLNLRIHHGRGVVLAPAQRADLELAAAFEVARDGRPGADDESTGLGWVDIWNDREVMARLRLGIAERLTQDARGPGWREPAHAAVEDALAAAIAAPDSHEADLDRILGQAALSEGERAVIEALLAADPAETQAAMAQRLRIARGTFSAQLDRALKKIRATL